MTLPSHCLALAVALFAAVAVGLAAHAVFTYAYSHHLFSYDISDGRGHGPDPDGIEGRHAYAHATARQSRLFGITGGLLGFSLPYVVLFIIRRATNVRESSMPWHAVWVATFALLSNAWLCSTAMFAWPMHELPAIGTVVVPISFLAGLSIIAIAVVGLFKSRDWRLLLAALLGAIAVVLFIISFLVRL